MCEEYTGPDAVVDPAAFSGMPEEKFMRFP